MADKPQLDKFKAAAREAECDTDEAAFDRALDKIVKADPPPKDEKQDKGKPAE